MDRLYMPNMRATTTSQALMAKSHANAQDVLDLTSFSYPTASWTDMASETPGKEPVWGEGTCPVCFTQRSCNGSCSC